MTDDQLDIKEQIARIDRAIAEAAKYAAEQRKLETEAQRFDREHWQIVIATMTTGAALFGAGAAFIKLLVG